MWMPVTGGDQFFQRVVSPKALGGVDDALETSSVPYQASQGS